MSTEQNNSGRIKKDLLSSAPVTWGTRMRHRILVGHQEKLDLRWSGWEGFRKDIQARKLFNFFSIVLKSFPPPNALFLLQNKKYFCFKMTIFVTVHPLSHAFKGKNRRCLDSVRTAR